MAVALTFINFIWDLYRSGAFSVALFLSDQRGVRWSTSSNANRSTRDRSSTNLIGMLTRCLSSSVCIPSGLISAICNKWLRRYPPFYSSLLA